MDGACISNLGWSVRQRIGEADCVEGHPRTKQFTVAVIIAAIITIHHCHAAAAVEVGLNFLMLSILLLECIDQLREQLLVVGVVNRDCSSQCRRLATFVST